MGSAGRPSTSLPPPTPASRSGRGFTLIEMLFAVAIASALMLVTLPATARALDEIRAASAARYLAGRLMALRLEAVRQSRAAGLRFRSSSSDYLYAPFVDGNGNGLRTAEMDAGVDRQIGPWERLGDKFPGVRFGLRNGLPDADGSPNTGEDGVRIGTARFLTFGVDGSATPGTLYIDGRGGQYAVRVLGTTGRARVLACDEGLLTWRSH